MFPDTITITTSLGVDKVLNRVNQDNYGSEYLLADATTRNTLKIRHSSEGVNSATGVEMERHNLLFEQIVYATATDPESVRTYTMTVRLPKLSDPSVASDIASGVQTWLGTSTNLADIVSGIN